MNRARTPVASLLALTLLLGPAAYGQPKPLPDPLRATLQKKGYTAVPLLKDAHRLQFTIDCKSGTEAFRLDLDTGADSSSLDTALVKKLGLKPGDEVESVGIGGAHKTHEISLRGMSIGDFDTRTMANALPLRSGDYSKVNVDRKDRQAQGLLGNGALRMSSAVIDYSGRTLYLRTPLRSLWPEIAGTWVATGGREEGRERKIDAKAPPKLEFKDNRFHLTDGANQHTFGVHVRPEEHRSTLVFFDPEREFAEELGYKAGGLMKVSDGKLTVCLCLDLTKAKKGDEFPDDFEAEAGSGHLLLEFRREKPAERPVAVADPLRAALVKKGYTAVPLVEMGDKGFVVECQCGTEKLRLLLDTGAEISALDKGFVQKLGLKPQNDVTAFGFGGSLEGVGVSLRGLRIGDFDTRTTIKSLDVAAFDFTAINTALTRHLKLKPIDGLLGHWDLEIFSAVIDYSTRTLYLRTPLQSLWPSIEGKWVATHIHDDGQERPLDPKAPLKLELKENRFHLTDGVGDVNFGMHVRSDKGVHTLLFFDPEKELDKELGYSTSGLLKVAGDKLTVCLSLGGATNTGIPDDFKAPAKSGRLLVEFRREK